MKKLLTILLIFFAAKAFGQVYQPPLLFGKYENRMIVLYHFSFPGDTIQPPVEFRDKPGLGWKNGVAYIWNPDTQRYESLSASTQAKTEAPLYTYQDTLRIGVVPTEKGGTGQTVVGSPYQLFRTNAGATGTEWWTPNFLTRDSILNTGSGPIEWLYPFVTSTVSNRLKVDLDIHSPIYNSQFVQSIHQQPGTPMHGMTWVYDSTKLEWRHGFITPDGTVIPGIDTLWVSSDTLYWQKSGNTYAEVLPSGGGAANTNTGSQYRALIEGTQEIKTFEPDYGIGIDSTSTTLKFRVDTANIAYKQWVINQGYFQGSELDPIWISDSSNYYTKAAVDALITPHDGNNYSDTLYWSGLDLIMGRNGLTDLTATIDTVGWFSEVDPKWIADSSNYYTKTQLQTSGGAAVHWDNITNVPSFQTYTFQHSIVDNAGVVNLVNDEAAPTASKYYGTDGSAVLGYHPLPTFTETYLGTVTSIATNNGTGITGGTITDNGTLAIDTASTISTKANATRLYDILNAAKQNVISGTGYSKFSGTSISFITAIPNADLANSTISGVALGGNLNNLSAGTGLQFTSGTTYNGSTARTLRADTATLSTKSYALSLYDILNASKVNKADSSVNGGYYPYATNPKGYLTSADLPVDEDDYRTTTQLTDSSYKLSRPNGTETVFVFESGESAASGDTTGSTGELYRFGVEDTLFTASRWVNTDGNAMSIYLGNSGSVNFHGGDSTLTNDYYQFNMSPSYVWQRQQLDGLWYSGQYDVGSSGTHGVTFTVGGGAVYNSLQLSGANGMSFFAGSGKIFITGLNTYDDDAAAASGGLTQNQLYKTSTGELRIKL